LRSVLQAPGQILQELERCTLLRRKFTSPVVLQWTPLPMDGRWQNAIDGEDLARALKTSMQSSGFRAESLRPRPITIVDLDRFLPAQWILGAAGDEFRGLACAISWETSPDAVQFSCYDVFDPQAIPASKDLSCTEHNQYIDQLFRQFQASSETRKCQARLHQTICDAFNGWKTEVLRASDEFGTG
jgi:hypothetical protein